MNKPTKLRSYAVTTPAAMLKFRPAILRALDAIGARSGGRYPSDRIFLKLQEELSGSVQTFALWLALDPARPAANANDAVVGFMTLLLVPDEIGIPLAFISRGWTAPGYPPGALFEASLSHVERWARARGARTILTMTERASKGDQSVFGRTRGLMAYARWIGRRGFRMRETLFEKELTA